MTATDRPANLPDSAQHLADARLHLRRCLIEVRAAAQANPALLTRLGSRYAALQAELEQLEQVQ